MKTKRFVYALAAGLVLGGSALAAAQGNGNGNGKGGGGGGDGGDETQPVELALGFVSEPRNNRTAIELSAIDGSGAAPIYEPGSAGFLNLVDIAPRDDNLAIVQDIAGTHVVRWDEDALGRPSNVTSRQVVSGYAECVALSADNQRVYYSPTYSQYLYSVSVNGGGPIQEYDLGNGLYFGECTGYNGQTSKLILAAVMDADPSAVDLADIGMGLARIDLSQPSIPPGYVHDIEVGNLCFSPDVSPDNQTIAYQDGQDVVLWRSGYEYRRIANASFPNFSCDGAQLVHTVLEAGRRGSTLTTVITTIATGSSTLFSADSKRRQVDWYC